MPGPEPARLRVVRPGLLTTVQDLGRFGFRRFGMPVGGAMDTIAFRLANRLVGNPDHAAALEITVQGPELIFETGAVFALTGADLSPMLNGSPVPGWTSMTASPGSTLRFGARRSGARAYLAVAGGIEVPLVLGSRSTHLASHTGGFAGRALAKDDLVRGGEPSPDALDRVERSVPLSARPSYRSAPVLRAILGPQARCFKASALDTLVSAPYTVSAQSDRMGYRLAGPLLAHAGAADIISEPIPAGAVQVPANQQPILLMVDRPTTGGYPKIAMVISADLPLAAQVVPGETLGFALVDVAQAQVLFREQHEQLDDAMPPIR